MADNWIEITIDARPEILEELSPQLFALGCQGINEQEKSFQLFFAEEDWDETKHATLLACLQKAHAAQNITFKTLPSENWNEKWKENFKTFRVGQNIIVRPDWEQYDAKPNETVITITPKMAFGTGHHETTKLILTLLEKVLQPGVTVMDAGTGSAILAVYAAQKGARHVVAFDNDPEAIENARENTEINNVNDKIDLHCCELAEITKQAFDVILANINRNILLRLAPFWKDYSVQDGILILSGLLISDRDDIVKVCKDAGWQLEETEQLGEWMALLFRNK